MTRSGYLIGLVSSLKPVTMENGQVGAQLTLKLIGHLEPVARYLSDPSTELTRLFTGLNRRRCRSRPSRSRPSSRC